MTTRQPAPTGRTWTGLSKYPSTWPSRPACCHLPPYSATLHPCGRLGTDHCKLLTPQGIGGLAVECGLAAVLRLPFFFSSY
jgi:hypothetical protein